MDDKDAIKRMRQGQFVATGIRLLGGEIHDRMVDA